MLSGELQLERQENVQSRISVVKAVAYALANPKENTGADEYGDKYQILSEFFSCKILINCLGHRSDDIEIESGSAVFISANSFH